jgi:hypothetical protein
MAVRQGKFRDRPLATPEQGGEAATQQVSQLLVRRPDLLISEEYSSVVTARDRCHECGSFRLARPEMIVATLGYC